MRTKSYRYTNWLVAAVVCVIATIPAAAQGKIAFTSSRDGNSEIYVMNADGTNPDSCAEWNGDSEPVRNGVGDTTEPSRTGLIGRIR